MTAASAPLLFRNASVIDGTTPDVREGHDVLVEAGLIKEVSASRSSRRPPASSISRANRSCLA